MASEDNTGMIERVMSVEEQCWICLEEDNPKNLCRPCSCPRLVHPKCIAHWQIHSMGKAEETHCRFCNQQLANWKEYFVPSGQDEEANVVVAVYSQGKSIKIKCSTGPNGLIDFKKKIQDVLGLTAEEIERTFQFTFYTQLPNTKRKVKMDGLQSFQMAMQCASVSKLLRKESPGNC